MLTTCKQALIRQVDSALDMLENAINVCPESLWHRALWPVEDDLPQNYSSFWNVCAHVLFWLDFYLTSDLERFQPPHPITLAEIDPAGLVPDPAYTRAEILDYLGHGRQKMRSIYGALTPERAEEQIRIFNVDLGYYELQLNNLRHIQEHTAQLNLFLSNNGAASSGWISGSRKKAD